MRNVWSILLGGLLLAGLGCGKNSGENKAAGDAPPASAAASTNRQVYQVRGVVKEILSPKKVKVAHEEIPGYMVAMTMPFDVKNTNELSGLAAGDSISFDMVVTDDDGWIEKVAKVAPAASTNSIAAAETKTNEPTTFRRVREVDPLSVGDKMPDYPFVTEEGKPIRLSELKGQAIGFTFIFTRCPFPTFCPRISGNFEKVAAQLATSGVTNWRLLSITIDPRFDTPERLKDHAQRYQRDPAKWSFVTSEMIEIDAITEQFGLMFASRNGTIDHNLRSVIVDANGKIRQIFVGNEWLVTEFVDEMTKAAKGAPIESADAAAKAPDAPAQPAP
jgi:protein SCO1/2